MTLPISPITNQPSKLTQICRASVGIDDSQDGAQHGGVVWRGPGGSEVRYAPGGGQQPDPDLQKLFPGTVPTETPKLRAMVRRSVGIVDSPPAQTQAQVQRSDDYEASMAIMAGFQRLVLGLAEKLAQVNAALDAQVAAQPVQQSYAGRAVPGAEPIEAFAMRSACQPGATQQLLAPGQAQGGGGIQMPTTIVQQAPTSPAGMANAMVIQSRSGPMPVPVKNAERKPGTVSVAQACRAAWSRGLY